MPNPFNTKNNINKKDILLSLLFVFCITYLLQLFVRQVFQLYYTYQNQEFYHISEWLINFQGGFVRRGLRGEMIRHLNQILGLTPYTLVIGITSLSFIYLSLFFLKGFIKKGYPIFILPFVFFLGNPILNSFWLRPDSLLVILFISILYLLRKPESNILKIFSINIILILGILLHEIFIFIAIPIIVLLISYHLRVKFPEGVKNIIVSYLYACLCLIPSFIITLLLIINNGNPETVRKIWESWQSASFPADFMAWASTKEYPGAFEGMTKSMKEGLYEYSGQFMVWFYEGLYGPFMIVMTICVIYFILLNVNALNNRILCFKPISHKNKSFISSILILQLITTIPLYVLGWDYGRWIFFWVTSSFALILLVPQEMLKAVIPYVITFVSDKISCWSTQLFGESKGVVILLCIIIGVPFSLWGVQEYFNTSIIYILLKNISIIFKYILMALR